MYKVQYYLQKHYLFLILIWQPTVKKISNKCMRFIIYNRIILRNYFNWINMCWNLYEFFYDSGLIKISKNG